MIKSLEAVLAMTAMTAFAQGDIDRQPELQSLGIEQLCLERTDPAVLAEIDRRELFRHREMRSIGDGRIRGGIGAEALSCLLGPPRRVIAVVNSPYGQRTDAYVYSSGSATYLVVYIVHQRGAATVASHFESDDPDIYQRVSRHRYQCVSFAGGNCRTGYGRTIRSSLPSSAYGPPNDVVPYEGEPF